MKEEILFDSQTSFQGGMQNGFDPGHVADHQYYRGINITCRNGVIDSRPSFNEIKLDFSRLDYSQETIDVANENYAQALEALDDAQAVHIDATEAQIAAQTVWDLFISTYDQDRQDLVYDSNALEIEYEGMLADNVGTPGTWTDEQVAAKLLEFEISVSAIVDLDQSYDLNYSNLATSNSTLASTSAAELIAEAEVTRTHNIVNSQFDAEWVFYNGKFQGAEIYNTRTQVYSVVVISGHIFLIDMDSYVVSVITTKTNQLNELVDRCYFVQAENFFIIQDGIARPKILEGASMRDSDPSVPEIPVGKNMAYGHGRIAVQTSKRHFVMSDIFLATEPGNVLQMRETQFLNEGGGFTISGSLGNIVSLRYANVSDTSTGDGPLLAICDNGFSTFAVNNPRINWSNIPMQKEQMFGTGLLGTDAAVNIGEDIFYRSPDGIRSYSVGRSEAAGSFKYTDMSREVDSYIQYDKTHGASFLSMEFFDKRLLTTTSPLFMKAKMTTWPDRKAAFDLDPSEENQTLLDLAIVDDVCFKGIIAFDFSMSGYTKSSNSSEYTRSTSGSYDGIWTGIQPTKLLTAINGGKKVCVAFTKSSSGLNAFYSISNNVTGRDNVNRRIEHSIEFRSMPFKQAETYIDSPFIFKHLKNMTLWITDVQDQVDVSVFMRSDAIDQFFPVGTLKFLAKTRSVDSPQSIGAPQSRSMNRLKMLPEPTDENANLKVRTGYEFQFRIKWTGQMQLRRMLVEASRIGAVHQPNIDTVASFYPFDTFDQYAYKADIPEIK